MPRHGGDGSKVIAAGFDGRHFYANLWVSIRLLPGRATIGQKV
jgi:hypothetical protein